MHCIVWCVGTEGLELISMKNRRFHFNKTHHTIKFKLRTFSHVPEFTTSNCINDNKINQQIKTQENLAMVATKLMKKNNKLIKWNSCFQYYYNHNELEKKSCNYIPHKQFNCRQLVQIEKFSKFQDWNRMLKVFCRNYIV